MDQFIVIKDKHDNFNSWTIEEETENTYKIFSKGYITEIYKNKCYRVDGTLYSYEVRDNKFEHIGFALASFCEIRLED